MKLYKNLSDSLTRSVLYNIIVLIVFILIIYYTFFSVYTIDVTKIHPASI